MSFISQVVLFIRFFSWLNILFWYGRLWLYLLYLSRFNLLHHWLLHLLLRHFWNLLNWVMNLWLLSSRLRLRRKWRCCNWRSRCRCRSRSWYCLRLSRSRNWCLRLGISRSWFCLNWNYRELCRNKSWWRWSSKCWSLNWCWSRCWSWCLNLIALYRCTLWNNSYWLRRNRCLSWQSNWLLPLSYYRCFLDNLHLLTTFRTFQNLLFLWNLQNLGFLSYRSWKLMFLLFLIFFNFVNQLLNIFIW